MNTPIETTARLGNMRMSPRKLRLVVDLIRGMKATEALIQLAVSGKVAARPVAKLLASAMANAEHNHALSKETLTIVRAFVDGGPIMYRFTPRAMGRSAPIRKRTAHVTLVLSGEVEEKKQPKPKKQEEKSMEDESKETTNLAPKVVTKKATKKSNKKT